MKRGLRVPFSFQVMPMRPPDRTLSGGLVRWMGPVSAILLLMACVIFLGYWFHTKDQLVELESVEQRENDLRIIFERKAKQAANLEAYEQQLLDIDKNLSDGGNTNTSTYDAVPGNVISIETIDLESLGPNAVLGRRNSIDLRQ